ncbi:MAG: histidine kinase [Verrucomicrobia bacterium]|nr:histidine kinase [Verrucomicrobiota bacterium]
MTASPIAGRPTNASSAPAVAHLRRRRRLVLACTAGWTVVVGVALWWLLRDRPGPSIWIIGQTPPPHPVTTQRLRAVFQGDQGFQRLYPWALFGPYVALIACCFPLERGRLRLRLPLNLAACVAFVGATQLVSARLRTGFANVMIVRTVAPDPGAGTNTVQTEILRTGPADAWPGLFAEPPMQDDGPPALLRALPPRLQDGGLAQAAALLPPGLKPPLGMMGRSFWSTLLDLLAYGAVVGLAHSIHFYRRFREREHRALVLESSLANARLATLRAQLQPHFLFNSLNAVAALLRRDPRAAEATLMSLSDLLRLTLTQSERQEVALREELEVVRRYLEIQQTRFGDKLRVEQAIAPGTLDCQVPALLLQPLVENAIRHGIEPADKDGLLRLTADRLEQRLVLTVEDDGVGLAGTTAAPPEPARALAELDLPTPGSAPGLWRHGTVAPEDRPASAPASRSGTGVGLSNLQARLQTLYGSDQRLELVPRSAGGATVRIEIPWRRSEAPPGDADWRTPST